MCTSTSTLSLKLFSRLAEASHLEKAFLVTGKRVVGISVHPSIFYTHFILGSRVTGVSWRPSQHSQGKGGLTPGMSRQFITWPHREKQPFTLSNMPTYVLVSFHLTCMFLTVGRSRRTRREPGHTQGEHASATQKAHARNGTCDLL